MQLNINSGNWYKVKNEWESEYQVVVFWLLWVELNQRDGHVNVDVVDRCKANLQELGYFAQDRTNWNKASDSNRCWGKYDESLQELSNTECFKCHLIAFVFQRCFSSSV